MIKRWSTIPIVINNTHIKVRMRRRRYHSITRFNIHQVIMPGNMVRPLLCLALLVLAQARRTHFRTRFSDQSTINQYVNYEYFIRDAYGNQQLKRENQDQFTRDVEYHVHNPHVRMSYSHRIARIPKIPDEINPWSNVRSIIFITSKLLLIIDRLIQSFTANFHDAIYRLKIEQMNIVTIKWVCVTAAWLRCRPREIFMNRATPVACDGEVLKYRTDTCLLTRVKRPPPTASLTRLGGGGGREEKLHQHHHQFQHQYIKQHHLMYPFYLINGRWSNESASDWNWCATCPRQRGINDVAAVIPPLALASYESWYLISCEVLVLLLSGCSSGIMMEITQLIWIWNASALLLFVFHFLIWKRSFLLMAANNLCFWRGPKNMRIMIIFMPNQQKNTMIFNAVTASNQLLSGSAGEIDPGINSKTWAIRQQTTVLAGRAQTMFYSINERLIYRKKWARKDSVPAMFVTFDEGNWIPIVEAHLPIKRTKKIFSGT